MAQLYRNCSCCGVFFTSNYNHSGPAPFMCHECEMKLIEYFERRKFWNKEFHKLANDTINQAKIKERIRRLEFEKESKIKINRG